MTGRAGCGMLALLLAVAIATTVPASAVAPQAPADVRAFSAQRIACAHWSGEDPYDAVRARQILGMLRTLRCSTLGKDERRLNRRYARRPDILCRIAAASDDDGRPPRGDAVTPCRRTPGP
ncbi:hypothetical protein [Sphingomonas montana]|uniref:hypothetical protein n=1 Tax=Sphingomonas montana TaxID=1843236 RepID=UPI00096CF449|nr:hypothetical protein [Sphingomonas montana]